MPGSMQEIKRRIKSVESTKKDYKSNGISCDI